MFEYQSEIIDANFALVRGYVEALFREQTGLDSGDVVYVADCISMGLRFFLDGICRELSPNGIAFGESASASLARKMEAALKGEFIVNRPFPGVA